MENNKFEKGDIVYHKVNGLRMVVLAAGETHLSCRFVSPSGQFLENEFLAWELSDKGIDGEFPLYQLKSYQAK